jgi:predicted RNA-binding Zn-ribbon protein involved in translation (DUF1610 family)
MIDNDSNYDHIKCPICGESMSEAEHVSGDGSDLEVTNVLYLEDEEESFFTCPLCEEILKIGLEIYQERVYTVSKPTRQELISNNLPFNDSFIEDVPGQKFIWNNLFSDEG